MTCKDNESVKVFPYKVEGVEAQSTGIPYGVRMLEAPSLWEQGIDGEGVVVAILDTGCDINHPDLAPQVIGGRNFTRDNNSDPNIFVDTNGHGTHVAGTIAAHGNLMGVAPGCKLLIVKVLDGTGSGTYSGIVNGLNYAINWRGANGERVRVINMSLGGSFNDPNLHAAVKKAVDNNIAVVVAAGNEGDNDELTYETSYPGSYNEVIEVGAIDDIHKLAAFSNVNLEIDCVAPGVMVDSTYLHGKYATLSGTSMAAPHVAGALALLSQASDKAFKRTLTESELYAQLVKNTISLGYLKSTEGNGLVRLNIMDKMKSLLEYIRQNF
jgi:major intracellular serine protease